MANAQTTPTPNIPNVQSYEEVLSDMLSSYASSLGINDFNPGAVNLSFFEVVALVVARASGDIFQILRDYSVDRASGDALKLLAQEYGVIPASASPTTGFVNVIDTSFTKIFTTIYAGTNPPNIGSTTINVSDASEFPASGSIYIGRGTPDIEGPLPYTAVVPFGSYWQITLSSPTTKYHNLGETVILAQGGNRSIPANSIVLSPGVGSSSDIQYSITASAVILDGETEVDGVPITALIPGSAGNVPIGAIKAFSNPPFTGASVSNPLPLTSGQDSATDAQIRVQIKSALASTGLGTATAIESALVGATVSTPTGSDTIVNVSIQTNTNGSVTTFIDDGTGYEETSNGVGVEQIVNSAIGGETFFQLQTGGTQAPVAKAYLQSINAAPFGLSGGEVLAVIVGEITYQHVFASTDFVNPGSATAYEVTASINADSAIGFEALTAGGGTFVVIRAIAETDDTISVTTPTFAGANAATILGFPADVVETLRLYKNNIPLTKDGFTAVVFTQDQELWSNSIENGDTLILSVDGTAPITYTFLNADFIATGLYTSVAATNSLASWVEVFNNKLTGITASITGTQIELTSNLGASNRAMVTVSAGSTLVTKGMFSSTIGLSSTGKASDFTLDRNTAQFQLVVPLVAGDVLSAGDVATEGFIESASIAGGSVTLSSPGHFWLLMDTPGQIIPTGVISNTLLTVTKPAPNIVRYTSNSANAFNNVLPGDYLIVWSAELPANDSLWEARVHSVGIPVLSGGLDNVFASFTGIIPGTATSVTITANNVGTGGNSIAFTFTGSNSIASAIATWNVANPSNQATLTGGDGTQVPTAQITDLSGGESAATASFTGTLPGTLTPVTIVANNPGTAGNLVYLPFTGFNSISSAIATWNAENPTNQITLTVGDGSQVPTYTAANLDILITPSEWAAATSMTVTFEQGFVILRSALAPQRFEVPSGTSTLDQIVQALQPQSENVVFSVFQETNLVMATSTMDTSGSILMVTADAQGQLLSVAAGASSSSQTSLIAFYNSQDFTGDLPLFIHAPFASSEHANPPDSFITSAVSSVDLSAFPPNDLICMLQPYGLVGDSQPNGESIQEASLAVDGVTIGFATDPDPYLHRIRTVDRFYLGNPLDFGPNDTMVIILDNNPVGESFTIPFFRPALVNSTFPPNNFSFNAYDVNSGPTAQFEAAFGDFDFANFKVYLQAKKVLNTSGANTAILYRAVQYGSSGEDVTVNYIYPSGPNQAISSVVTVGPVVAISIILASGAISPNSIASSTQWNVTITPMTPSAGIDQVTYMWNGVGTNPALSLSGGEYVNISSASGFDPANTGIFRVSTQSGFAPTATSFTVQRPTGVAVAQSNALTLVSNGIIFYEPNPTTANQVITYVNANLSQYISASLASHGVSNTGNGVIVYSTYEDTGFTTSYVQLLDGINWIASSDLAGSPQFTLKVGLSLPSDYGYAFNNGDTVILSPTTMDQVQRLISILAVSGFTTYGTDILSDRDSRLELATQVLGSSGAIQVVGGTANEYGVPVLQAASIVNNDLMSVSANNVAAKGMNSDQWFRLQAATEQGKITGLADNSSVTIVGQDPVSGQSTVELLGRTLTERYFGTPRNNVRVESSTFRVEKQGALVCISWTGVGSNPNFVSALNFNDSGGGTVNVFPVMNTDDVQYIILTGSANFTELSIGNLITVAGMSNPANNGTFVVTGVSDNGTTIQVTNPDAESELSSGTFTFTGNANVGDVFTVGAINLTAGSYAFYSNTVPGTATPVVITANVLGTTGNSITLTFSGSNSISSAIATWNASNPLNTATLTSGDGTQVPTVGSIMLSGGANGNFAVGGSSTVTAANLAAAISALSGVTAAAVGNVVTVTATTPSASIAISYTPISTSEVAVSGASLVGTSFVAGNFTSTSGVSEGDTVIIGDPFSILNQGRFRVIRQYNNSIWIENTNMVQEEVNLPANTISLGYDATTSFRVNASGNTLYLEWTGVGTQPTLGNAIAGDVITVPSDFAAANRGSFMVIDSSPALQQITQLTLPSYAQLPLSGPGVYFEIWSAGNATGYYVWYNTGANTDPAPGGFTGVQVSLLSGDSATFVAAKTSTALNAIGGTPFIASPSGSLVTVSTSGSIETNPTLNISVPAPFSAQTLQSGTRTFLEAINPAAVNQSSVLVTSLGLLDNRPQMMFWEYEATVPGDLFVATGSILSSANAGQWPIFQVLNRTTAIVTGNMTSVTNVSLNNNTTSVFVQEGVPYSGYKQVYLVSAEPGSPNQDLILFNTNAQYEKINQSAAVEMTSLGKLNFNTATLNGLDSYRYNTGLIAEANRIVYGDPRDPITYPGVGAAGANIFIEAPLTLRITVGVDIRLVTGAPFSTIAQQVRTNVAYVVNSNPVGKSIPISSIVSSVQAIPGVLSVAISSPQYSPTMDLITVQPNEKARIIDPTTDINVSLIGS